MDSTIIKSWDLKSIVSISLLPNLNTERAVEMIESTQSISEFNKNPFFYNISSYFSNSTLFQDNKKDLIAEAEHYIEICKDKGYNIVTYWSENYPTLLKNIQYPPLVLYVWGQLQNADSAIISIVGTRHCTEYGKICTDGFAKGFVNANLIVASGLATGIDTYAHLSTIKENGITYAIIASGLDKISPTTSLANAKKIVESGGAILTTYPPGTNAIPAYFLQRNRIISGLAKGVLVVESAFKGGSLNTAKNAREQNREVYAVPGKINAEKSKGTNNLIKNSLAAMALTPEEIVKDLGLASADSLFNKKQPKIAYNANQKLIMSKIDSEPIGSDKISELTGLNITIVITELLELEFMNEIRQLPGNTYIKFKM